jgi:hypothetical protein
VVIIIFVALFGWITGMLKPIEFGTKGATLWYLIAFILGFLYFIFPFREASNKRYFDQVSENIRRELIRIAAVPDDPGRYTWEAVRGIFYSIVDNDQSLSTKSKLAYANGYAWTTVADIRALAAIFALLSILYFVLAFIVVGFNDGLWAIILFSFLYLVSFPVSAALTSRHQRIGNEQIEIIEHNHLPELHTKLKAIHGRAAP